MLYSILFCAALVASFGEMQGMMPGMGMNPYMQQSPFKTLPGANNPSVMMIFGDGVDAKDAQEFIAAGMLPRYLPLLTDGVDAGDAWLYGLGPAGMAGGATEASVIARAKMADPRAAALGRPANEELMPTWMKIVAAGLNMPPAGETANNGTETGDAGTGTGTGIADVVSGLVAGAGAGLPPMMAGNGPIEEYGDQESNAQIRAMGCNIGMIPPEEQNQVCLNQRSEPDCSACAVIGCMWHGQDANTGMCMGMPEALLQKSKSEPVLQETQPEQNSQSQGWPENVNPVYTLTFGVLAGAVFGCGLGMVYSRCTSKTNAFEEAMIHLDNARV